MHKSSRSLLTITLGVCLHALPGTGCALIESLSEAVYADSDLGGSVAQDMPSPKPDADMSEPMTGPCAACPTSCLRVQTPAGEDGFCTDTEGKIVEEQVPSFVARCASTMPTEAPPSTALNDWPSSVGAADSVLTVTYQDRTPKVWRTGFDRQDHFPQDPDLVRDLGPDPPKDMSVIHVSPLGATPAAGALLLGYRGDDQRLRAYKMSHALDPADPSLRFETCEGTPPAVALNLARFMPLDQAKVLLFGAFKRPEGCSVELVLWEDLTKPPDDLAAKIALQPGEDLPSGPLRLSDQTGPHPVATYLHNNASAVKHIEINREGVEQLTGNDSPLRRDVSLAGLTESMRQTCKLFTEQRASLDAEKTRPAPVLATRPDSPANGVLLVTSWFIDKAPGHQLVSGNFKSSFQAKSCYRDDRAPVRQLIGVDLLRTSEGTTVKALVLSRLSYGSASEFDGVELVKMNGINGVDQNVETILSLRLSGHTLRPLRLHPAPNSDKASMVVHDAINAQNQQIMVMRVDKRSGRLSCSAAKP